MDPEVIRKRQEMKERKIAEAKGKAVPSIINPRVLGLLAITALGYYDLISKDAIPKTAFLYFALKEFCFVMTAVFGLFGLIACGLLVKFCKAGNPIDIESPVHV